MSAPAALRDRLGTSASNRTLRAMLATALAVLPLAELFTDQHWVLDAWMAIAIVVVPAAILRINREPRVWHTWVGVAMLVPWLTARFLSDHAIARFIPTAQTWDDLNRALDGVRATTRDGVAPVHPDPSVTFVLALVIGLVAAFVDLIAVVGRRPALAGVPILIVFTVAGAVPRHPVTWIWFVAAASGFLLLLSLDAGDTIRDWGRVIPRAGETRARAVLSVSGPRIAVVALAIAVLIPVIVPTRATNLLADFLHSGGSGTGTGSGGFGAGSGIALDPFAGLKGNLQQKSPTPLFTVTLDDKPAHQPFYLRANVLSTYTDRGWIATSHGGEQNIVSTDYGSLPPSDGTADSDTFTVTIGITGLADNPPVFTHPVSVSGLDNGASWSDLDQLLLGPKTHRGQQILEQVSQPNPSIGELNSAASVHPDQYQTWLQVPNTMPSSVTDLVNRIAPTGGTEYQRALALNSYFTDTNNGFLYSLTVPGGDSGSALVDFLHNKQGYCQQFAAALGIMLRIAHIPSRVVLGYTHSTADARAQFHVTTANAHAWVEVFFPGLGWIPFDPTPLAGIAGGSTADLTYAPHPHATPNPDDTIPTQRRNTATGQPSGGASSTSAPGGASRRDAQSVGWLVWAGMSGLLVLAIGVVPATVRWWRRRVRIHAARGGDADALWAELSDTARDLGYVWSTARTPRQVVDWLGPQLAADRHGDGPLAHLATAVEQSRYAPPGMAASGTTLVTDLRSVEGSMRGGRSRSTRLRSRLWPASLGWGVRRLSWRRRH